ncbi:MAG: acyl carrier protein [Synergistes sp.]|nr:acyl carrier protein [Synergistes sp.]
MTNEEKLDLIAETIDAERADITPSAVLAALDEWDSIGMISILSMLDRKFGVVLTPEQIEELTTVQDILDKMGD